MRPPPARFGRLTALVLTGTLAATGLGACSNGTPGADAAEAAASHYLELLATAEGEQLETLWRTTVTEDPGALRVAGDVLAGATERIEVVAVGDAARPSSPPRIDQVPTSVDGWDSDTMLEVPVTYRLAGSEHDDVVLLAARTGADIAAEGAWVVLTPLLGTIAFEPVPFASITYDVLASGVRLVGRAEQQLYPAVYDVERRADPYLEAAPAEVTVTAGAQAAVPAAILEGTAAAVDALRDSVLGKLDQCAAPHVECPFLDLLEQRGVDPWEDDWWRGVVTAPEIAVDGASYTATDGVVGIVDASGAEVQLTFDAAGDWWLDNTTWVPAAGAPWLTAVTP